MSNDLEKDWTIMVYMAGDNNLSENMAYSLNDLGAFGAAVKDETRLKVNLLAFFDSSSLTAPTHYFDFSEEKPDVHPIEKRDIHHNSKSTPKPDEPGGYDRDGNSASAYSIMNFVRWCIETKGRKAKNYALIFSGHSFGFHGTSFLRDEGSGGFITLFKFRWALEEVIDKYLGDKISILGFDSCVMSMLEVGYELKKTAQILIASEGSLPNAGWGYAPMLQELIASNGKSFDLAIKEKFHTEDYVKEAASVFVEAFTEHQKKLAVGGRSVDIAAWDLKKIDPVAENLRLLAQTLNERLDLTEKIHEEQITDADISVYQELRKIILQSHFDSQTYMKEQCVDLKDFCQRLAIECSFMTKDGQESVFNDIIKVCKDIVSAVDDCVLKCGYSGEEYQFSNGISLYFPWTYVTYFLTNYRYRYLRFTRGADNRDLQNPKGVGKEWNEFLFNYLTRVTLRTARKSANDNGLPRANFDQDNSIWSKDNPRWSRDNPRWSRDNPPYSRDNPPYSRDNPRSSRAIPHWGRGEIGEYLFYFSRFKNFQLSWNISGYSDEKDETIT